MAFVTDTYTDASVALTSHVPDSGGSIANATGADYSGTAITTASTNRARPNTGTAYRMFKYSGTPAGANYTVQCDVLTTASAVQGKIGCGLRQAAAAQTAYFVYTDGTTWTLWKVVAGSYTSLGTFSQSLGTNSSFTVALQASGTTISVTITGQASPPQISVTDSSISAAGVPTVWIEADTGSVNDTVGPQIDNFSATDAGGAAVIPNLIVNKNQSIMAAVY